VLIRAFVAKKNFAFVAKKFNKFVATVATLLFLNVTPSEAQLLSNPLNFPLQLSGGFGDLRANHYHAGLDFRTRSSEGHPLYSVLDGYISRVTVSPGGYGLAVYLTHPSDSLITVYGHLQAFTLTMAALVKEKQYEKESFTIDISFKPDEIPVNQGDVIGFSGNTGSSNGPHLHFEVRDMNTNDWLNPLIFYHSQIPDSQKPQLRGLRIYPIEGKGAVYGSNTKQDISFTLDKNGQPIITQPIEAWGEIGIGIRATDRMNGTNFNYGIKDILMTVDSIELYRSHIDRISPNESRYVNSQTDYEEWSKTRTFFIKTFTDPGNSARFIASRNSGKITIEEERIYNVVITLTDFYGNTLKIPVKLKGKNQDITPIDTAGAKLLRWYDYNPFSAKGIRMTFPRNSLYSSLYMRYRVANDDNYNSPIHILHPTPVPLHYPAQLSLFIDSIFADSLANKYGIVQIALSTGRRSWIGGVYRDGWFDTEISELGAFAVTSDFNPPRITPIGPATWRAKKKISVLISDDLSGIASYRGEIDGQFVLFEYDSKNALITYTFDNERLQRGAHTLKITVTDRCGNLAAFQHPFTY